MNQPHILCQSEMWRIFPTIGSQMSEMSEKSDIIAKTVILIDLWKLRKC